MPLIYIAFFFCGVSRFLKISISPKLFFIIAIVLLAASPIFNINCTFLNNHPSLVIGKGLIFQKFKNTNTDIMTETTKKPETTEDKKTFIVG